MPRMTSRTTPSLPFPRVTIVHIWFARDLAALGNAIFLVGLLAFVYAMDEKATSVSLLLAAQLIPLFIGIPLARAVANGRFAQVVGVASLLARAAALWPLLSVSSSSDWPAVITSAGTAAFFLAFSRVSFDLLRGRVRDAGLSSLAETAFSTTTLLAMAVGAVGGVYLYWAGGLFATTMTAMGAMVVAAAYLAIGRLGRPTAREPGVGLKAAFSRLGRGIAALLADPRLGTVGAIYLVAQLLTGGVVAVLVNHVTWGLFVTADNLGLILGALLAGVLLGVVWHRLAGDRPAPSTVVTTALALVSGGIFAFSISSTLQAGLASSAAVGAGLGLLEASTGGLVAALIPDKARRSHARAALATAGSLLALASMIVLGPIADAITSRVTLLAVTILLATLSLYAFGATPDPERPATGPDEAAPEAWFPHLPA